MKRSFILLVLALLLYDLSAQDVNIEKTSGIVSYERVVKLDIKLEGDAAQFASSLPKEQRSLKELRFNKEASLYSNSNLASDEEAIETAGGATMQFKMMEPEHKVFCELSSGRQIEQKEFMSRIFLIEKEISREDWKLTGKQKEILGYSCQEAIMEKEETHISAWFTPEIAVPSGPAGYINLPGLVLEVDIDEGESVIIAKSLEFKEIDTKLLKKPSKGKKVSEEEFDKIVAAKMEEMGVEGEGGVTSTFVIKIDM